MSVNKNAINNQLQNRGNFAQIPNEIYEVADFSNSARSIWIYLASEGPGWKGSYPNIARNMDLSIPTVRTAVSELIEKNMLIVTPHAEGTDFELVPSTNWKVTWKVRPVKKSYKAQANNLTGANKESLLGPVQKFACIQEDPIRSNTTNTTASNEAGSEVKVSERVKDLNLNEFLSPPRVPASNSNKSTPDYLNHPSSWFQHYLKSSLVQSTYLSLPRDTQQALYDQSIREARVCGSEAKDNFVSSMIEIRNKSLLINDAEVSLCDL